MTCQPVAELLPWLLNGSLGADETATMLVHLRDCPGCRAELASARAAQQIYGAHLPVAALVEYAFGETPPGLSRAEVATHLAACGACRMELDLVRQDAGAEPVAAVDAAAAAVRAAAHGELPVPAIRSRSGTRRLALAAACVLALVGAFGLGRWQVATERAPTAVASTPTADFAALELWPSGRVERGSPLPAASMPAVPASVSALVTLRTDDVTPFPGYALELYDGAGTLLWRSESVTRQPAGEFVLELPGGALPPGDLQIRLFGRVGEHWSEIERYALRLAPSGG